MNISVFGAGYVGLVTAVGLAELGNTVLCADIDKRKIDQLKLLEVPFFEPGITDILERNSHFGRLRFTTSHKEAISFGDIIFIAVGTPPNDDGSANLDAIFEIAKHIGDHLDHSSTIVTKSTVPVGTSKEITNIIRSEMSTRNEKVEFNIVSNPEFLKEGAALDDFMKPDRIIVGADTAQGFEVMRELYAPLQRKQNIQIEMDLASAELTKYAANSMLATRISLMNEISKIAELVGADIEQVRHGIGSDPRIGPSFLYAGCGYGGSCFPKDVNALIHTAETLGLAPRILKSIESVNENQKNVLFEKVCEYFGNDLSEKTFTIWGLSFKPDTDDMRSSPCIPLVRDLTECGAQINAYDPVSTNRAREIFGDGENIRYYNDKYSALQGSDALILVTEWKEFRSPDFFEIHKSLRNKVLFDGRNQWDPLKMRSMGFQYFCIGRSTKALETTAFSQ